MSEITQTCAKCGRENPAEARFCNACGTELVGAGRDVRKRVTVIFVDLAGSTTIGERLDTEALRGLMRDYYAELRSILERHGATVEKFIGDAVMAVFGVPNVHEDDALRAVHAAVEIRRAVEKRELVVRIGVNTGEVVTGDGETLVTGDAVNVAARLEQAARPGEILMGDVTHGLVRDAIESERLEPLAVRGKAEPVVAFRLRELAEPVPAFTRRIDTPFVGRADVLAQLEATFTDAVEQRRCHLCTVIGPPGIGKSRLARELLTRADAGTLIGRCLPYGEGITYWPLTEMVEQLPRPVAEIVGSEEHGDVVAERIAGAVGAGRGSGAAEEIAWAARKLVEALARERPLIVVVDDVHWAEPTFLDLLEYVAAFSSDAPMLLLCLARADLLDERPSWASPRSAAHIVTLEPLSDDEARLLADELGDRRPVSEQSKARAVDAAEGNPLFVEQFLAMSTEVDRREPEVPDTIQALLAARIDALEPEQRHVVECASIEGRLFHRRAVAALVGEAARGSLGAQLMTLVRKDLIRPDRALFPEDDGFRFAHVLVRDAAYASVAKRRRAELHERFADWLAETAGTRVDNFVEILAYHTEQAFLYRIELDADGEAAARLGSRAAERLGRAGELALTRGDMTAAINLLERGVAAAPPDDRQRPMLLNALGFARMHVGALADAERTFERAIATAQSQGNERVAARAASAHARLLMLTGRFDPATTHAEAARLIDALQDLEDDAGLATAWLLMGDLHNFGSDNGGLRSAAENALVHARRAGEGRGEAEAIFWIAVASFFGREPATAAAARLEQLLRDDPGPVVRAHLQMALAGVRSLQGDIVESRRLYRQGRAAYQDLGLALWAAGYGNFAGVIELNAGDLATAESELRTSAAELAEIGESSYRSTVVALLARTLCLQGRDAEAEQHAGESLAVDPDDTVNRILCNAVLAIVAGRRGDFDRALALANEAVRVATAPGVETMTDADAYMDLAEVLRLAGRDAEETVALRQALRLFEAKENIPGAARARARLAAVRTLDV